MERGTFKASRRPKRPRPTERDIEELMAFITKDERWGAVRLTKPRRRPKPFVAQIGDVVSLAANLVGLRVRRRA